MSELNFIKLLQWDIYTDDFGSEYQSLENSSIAVSFRKVRRINNRFAHVTVKLHPNNSFSEKTIRIPECSSFSITYKTQNDNNLIFCIEQDSDKYFACDLPPSKEWTTEIIKIKQMRNINNVNLDLNNITSFIFCPDLDTKDEISDVFCIKELFVDKYEIVALKNTRSFFYTKYIMKKCMLNNFRILFLENRQKKYKLFDTEGNPLYCTYPFRLFYINLNYCSICCWLFIDDNIDFEKNRKLHDVWFSDKFDKIRNRVRDLSYSECNLENCAKVYDDLNADYFKSLPEIRKETPEIADYLEGKVDKFLGLPQYMMIGFDSTCNLSCRSCTVTGKEKLSIDAGKKYIEQIEEIGGNLERLMISCYGDPFASPVYRNWLFSFDISKFPKLNRIELMTNGILWTEDNWNRVSDNIKQLYFAGVISIDGATRETYEYNRGGAKFETLIKNLKFISTLRKRNEINLLMLTFVVQENNYREIPLAIDFAKEYSFDRVEFNKIQNWGSYSKEEFNKINIFDVKHPDHTGFKTLCKKVKGSCNNKEIEVYFKFEL